MELFDRIGIAVALRWLHVVAGICWIGLLWYFNLIQVPAFAQLSPAARSEAIAKLASRALWWFRWSAIATLVLGLLITGAIEDYYKDFFDHPEGIGIFIGMIFGITMAANVWMVIWPNQRTVIASAVGVLEGREALAESVPAARRAGLASRQNFIFSIPMLWWMVFAGHNWAVWDVSSGGTKLLYLLIAIGSGVVFELNALGIIGGTGPSQLKWPYENHRNAIITGFAYWAVLWILWEILFSA